MIPLPFLVTQLAKGYPIATGVIEGACRYLVKDRMEITGARWGLEGGEAVLKLRALYMNWLQVLGYAEPPQIDECVGHQLHAIVPTLMVLEPQQQPLKFVLPGKRPFDSVP